MCIKPRTIVNRKYVKLAGSTSKAEVLFRHSPDLYLLVDCGRCLPCLRKKSNYWRQRLLDEFNYFVKDNPDNKYKVYFVTLTFANKHYKKDVDFAHNLFTMFRERYRKRFGVSLRFWCCTEYGEKRGRLHLHAIFFNPLISYSSQLQDLWTYGRCDMSVVGYSPKNRENDPLKGIAYVTKYITKTVDKWFINWSERSRIFCSPGIGLRYCLDVDALKKHTFKGSPLFFRVDESGKYPQALPRYYVSKIFSPLDIVKRQKANISRLHSAPQFPLSVLKHRFNDFESYVSFVQSIGGKVTLLSTQLDKMSESDKKIYLNQKNYEQPSIKVAEC